MALNSRPVKRQIIAYSLVYAPVSVGEMSHRLSVRRIRRPARSRHARALPGVVEDDAQGVAAAVAQAAHAVAHIDAIDPARALHGAMVDRKDHRLALRERHHLGARL